MSAELLEPPLKRLRTALDLLEAAVERWLRQEGGRADGQEELALMQDDRTRLATELDGALGRNRDLAAANVEAARRIERASAVIKALLERPRSEGAE